MPLNLEHYFVRRCYCGKGLIACFTLHLNGGYAVITARKGSLQRLRFYTCLSISHSVHGGGGVCPSACWDARSPWTRGRHPPSIGMLHYLRKTLDQRQTPGTPTPGPEAHPSAQAVHAGRYGQQAGGTHPTGMYTCWIEFLNIWSLQKQVLGKG